MQDGPGHEAVALHGGERLGEVVGRADPAGREAVRHRGEPFGLGGAVEDVPHGGVDPARRDGVDPDRRELQGQRAGERFQRAVGGGEHGRARARAVRGDAGGEGDRAAGHDVRSHVLGHQPRPEQLGVQRGAGVVEGEVGDREVGVARVHGGDDDVVERAGAPGQASHLVLAGDVHLVGAQPVGPVRGEGA
ncbi:hypothetical protein LZG04_29185 [Saccharothrix sp. S26]|nr:hypothetical protein [Saccharothrix sp. S26]MCE6998843.1 hypothetical protein [Saccharothrix sp. S26]